MSARKGLIFPASLGALAGLALVKFGNPVILESLVVSPATPLEWGLNSWPARLGYLLVGVVAAIGLLTALARRGAGAGGEKEVRKGSWIVALPALWLAWQCLATAQSVNRELSVATVCHFASCVVCFYLGYFLLARAVTIRGFLVPVAVALLVVIGIGWRQHFGGLEDTRRYFFAYIYPTLPQVSPEYLKKISSNRIFATLFYPNSLAGALLLLLPVTIALMAEAREFTVEARRFLVAVVGVGGAGCMGWSGSKAGWLLAMVLWLIAALRLPISRKAKTCLVAAALVVGMAGFGLRYAGYFRKGATSAAARADYWRAAAQTAMTHPLTGTGPGTFAIPYKQLKKPESEMARLVHNDYLEQASDSGWVGFLLYAAFWVGGLVITARKAWYGAGWLEFCVWLGVLGWGMQSVTEFGLYIPALAWPAFALMGWLLGGRGDSNGFDRSGKISYSRQ